MTINSKPGFQDTSRRDRFVCNTATISTPLNRHIPVWVIYGWSSGFYISRRYGTKQLVTASITWRHIHICVLTLRRPVPEGGIQSQQRAMDTELHKVTWSH